MGGIDWHAFTWEAFATLVTGLLAVGAAYYVGKKQLAITAKQAGISEKQNEILERQTRLNELSLRHDLFERRHEVYAAVRDFLVYIAREGQYPDRNLEIGFLQAMNMSRLLFDLGTHDRLDQVWRQGVAYQALKKEMDSIYRREGHYGPGNPEKEAELFLWLTNKLANLPDLFGDALRLG